MSTLGQKLRSLRKQQNLTQLELAQGFVTVAMIGQIENDRVSPSAEVLAKLGKRLGVEPSYFDASFHEAHVLHQMFRQARVFIEERKFTEALALLQEVEVHDTGAARSESVQQCIAECYEGLHEIKKAADIWEQVVTIRLEHDDLPAVIRIYYRLGNAYRLHHNVVLARLYWERAVHWMERSNQFPATTSMRLYGNLGRVYLQFGNFDVAEIYYKSALRNIVSSTSAVEKAAIEHGLGNLYLEQERFEQARYQFERALETYQVEQHDRGVNQCEIHLAVVLKRQGNPQAAVAALTHCMDEPRMKEDNLRMANALCTRAACYLLLSRVEQAFADAEQALSISRESYIQTSALALLTKCAQRTGDTDQAVVYAAAAVEAADARRDMAHMAAARTALRQAHLAQEQTTHAMADALDVAQTAVKYLRHAHEFARQLPEK